MHCSTRTLINSDEAFARTIANHLLISTSQYFCNIKQKIEKKKKIRKRKEKKNSPVNSYE